MNPTRTLLLDFSPTRELSDSLRLILEPLPDFEVRLLQTSAEEFREQNAASRAGGGEAPGLIFLITEARPACELGPVVRALRRAWAEAPVIAVMESCEPSSVFDLLKMGVADFVTAPLRKSDILPRAWRLAERARTDDAVGLRLTERLGLKQLVGASPAFVSALEKIPLVASSEARVLIFGETGTGKELCARAIHYLSPRSDMPFIAVNCGAIPAELVENELFGHERGAFTGAASPHAGLIREAEGGTLFLDEIDCLPLLAQVKLLRFLQEMEYRPLGSARTRTADVRVISATNTDLEDAVCRGMLRRDLYYRLNIVPLTLPPLRERREDIPVLAVHFLSKFARDPSRAAPELSDEAALKLQRYDWPGNVRELEYVIERAVLLSRADSIGASDILLPEEKDAAAAAAPASFREAKARIVEQFERSYINQLLVAYHGNITMAAEAAKKNRRAFWQLIRKHRINAQSFRPSAT